MATTKSLLMATSDTLKPLLDQLPRENWWAELPLYQWEGFWYTPRHLDGAMAAQSHFEARDDDVIIASSMKTGTTWLKALISCIMNRPYKANNIDGHGINDSDEKGDKVQGPLIGKYPSAYVQTLEIHVYKEDPTPDLSGNPSPRLFHTHMPYNVLPESIKNSQCKIVYITRNRKTRLYHCSTSRTRLGHLSKCHFPWMKHSRASAMEFMFVGHSLTMHVLQYWKESVKSPPKILFLKYEDMKRDTKGQLKRLASFLERPIAEEDEVDMMLERCSLEKLKNLEVNLNGADPWLGISNSSFFWSGIVGDWKNHLTPGMKDRLNQIAHMKLEGSGLDLEI